MSSHLEEPGLTPRPDGSTASAVSSMRLRKEPVLLGEGQVDGLQCSVRWKKQAETRETLAKGARL